MALAYLILAHREPAQVARLFNAIHHHEDTFILHIDRRAPPALHVLAEQLSLAHDNVHCLPAREISWGGSFMAEQQIAAMEIALKRSPHWTHFVNLTGQDFPLKSRNEILTLLATTPNQSYLSWFDPLESGLWRNARERLTRHHFTWPWLQRVLALPGIGRRLRRVLGWRNQLPWLWGYRRPLPEFFHYYGGANHVVLARAAVRHLVSDPAALRIRRWLRPAGHGNEIIFQSVLLNSPLAPTLTNDSLREIVFPRHSPHPQILTSADLPRLLASHAFFARKFDPAVDSEVITALERRLHPPVLSS